MYLPTLPQQVIWYGDFIPYQTPTNNLMALSLMEHLETLATSLGVMKVHGPQMVAEARFGILSFMMK